MSLFPSRKITHTHRHEPLNGATEHRIGRDIKLTEALTGTRSADPDAMQDDGADGAPLTRTTTMERSITKQKADRAQKKARIQKRKAAPKPSNAMRFSAKKKTRKGGK